MAGRLLTALTFALSVLGVTAAPAPEPARIKSSTTGKTYLGIPISNPDVRNPVPNRYIVVYNNTFSDEEVEAHETMVIKTIAKRNLGKRSPHTGKFLSTAVKTFKVNGWRAMSLEADDVLINEIFESKEVSYIEQDEYISLNARSFQGNAPTGLARISHATAGNRGYIFDDSGGEGITAYVVDTGIRLTHSEFEGRAVFGANFVDNSVRIPPYT
mgnify:FL=1